MAKEKWGSKLGVILAVTGSAVGLGNFCAFRCRLRQWQRRIYDSLHHCISGYGLADCMG